MPLITCYTPTQYNGMIHSNRWQWMEITQQDERTCSNHA